jgi:cell division septation protein DedD
MDSDSEGAGGSPPSSPWSSDGGRDGGRSDATSTTTAILATPPETIGCQQATLKDEFNQLAAYLAEEKALKAVRNAFKQTYDAYTERVDNQATKDSFHLLGAFPMAKLDQCKSK